jgi:hypothetical protein
MTQARPATSRRRNTIETDQRPLADCERALPSDKNSKRDQS